MSRAALDSAPAACAAHTTHTRTHAHVHVHVCKASLSLSIYIYIYIYACKAQVYKVMMASDEDAEKGITALHGLKLYGQKLDV